MSGQCYHQDVVELRRHPRAPSNGVVEFAIRGSSERASGQCRDISLGGMYVETAKPLPFGTEVVAHVTFPGEKAAITVAAVVRWSRAGEGMGLQFGLMGARETHAITEATRRAAGRDEPGPGKTVSS
jgi:Tfp pilus assembly protein PilZ